MIARHTPAPWYVVRYGDGDSLVICTDEAGDRRVAFMATPGCRDQVKHALAWKEIKANARLIAAAPELLEALEALMPSNVSLTNRNIRDMHTLPMDVEVGALRRAAAAIAKARGEA